MPAESNTKSPEMQESAPLNWLANANDVFSRPGAVDLQSSIHRDLVKNFANEQAAGAFLSTDRSHWRRLALMKSQLVIGRPISGTVMEIGAGSGWCSSLLSLLPSVTSVYCVDYDPVAVNVLMPQVQKVLGATSWKIQRVLGTFNNIPLEGTVDFIASVGAIHHSENLYATLAECFKALKPGGWMFASEPVYADGETNEQLHSRYKKEDPTSLKRYGRVTRQEDNSDHYYRLCEFTAAAYGAKFDVYPFVFDLTGNRNVDDRTLSERRTATGFHTNVLYPYFAKNAVQPMFDSLMLMLQKPSDGGHGLGHILSGNTLGY